MANRILEIQKRLRQKYENSSIGGGGATSSPFSRRVRSLSDQSFDLRFPVPLVPQQTGMSCWAAGAAMVVAWRENYSADPARIAQGAGEWAAYSSGLHPESTTIFPVWGLTPEPQQSYSVDGFRRLLETYGPLWVAGAVPGPHIRVVTGLYGDGTPDGTRVIINDPWQKGMASFALPNAGAQYEETYRQFVTETERLARQEAGTFPNAIYVARSTRPRTSGAQSRGLSGFAYSNGSRRTYPVVPNFRARALSLPVDYDVPRAVPGIKKPSPMTCWAAATAMLVSYKDGRSVTVEEAVRRAGGRYEQAMRSDAALTKADATDYLSALGLSSAPAAELSVDQIHQMLRRFGAVWLTPDYAPAFSLDARIVTAVHGDGTPGGTNLTLLDPGNGGEASVAFDRLGRLFEQQTLANPTTQLMAIHWPPDTLGTAIPQGTVTQSSYHQRTRSLSNPLSDWAHIVSFRPSTATQRAVVSRTSTIGAIVDKAPWSVHKIEDAYGDVNLDYYPVHVARLPASGPGSGGAAELLAHIRRNMNSFVDTGICEFKPYDPEDAPVWTGANPLNAVVHIDMKVNVAGYGLNLDDGAVVVSEAAPDHWIFSTIHTLGDGDHPVSGNRQFGFTSAPDGGFLFYTRAADRLTGLVDYLAADAAFGAADRLWKSFQNAIVSLVNGAGGSATALTPTSARHRWPADVSGIYSPTVPWYLPTPSPIVSAGY
ncbi:MAG: hypothetical protein H8F28_15755 [Fibrella sp.]|nr:hypothetical protein [Armatimonadota bacterium]